MLYILHLSDLHFSGREGEDTRWLGQLSRDMEIELRYPRLDAVIISGDITNGAKEAEYQKAQEFLFQLSLKFNLKNSQVIIVPGNHDVNWELGDKAYRRSQGQNGLQCDQSQHKLRFGPFAEFYRAIRQQPYPLDYQDQGILYHLPEQNLLILGLNSAWQLDRFNKQDAHINIDALNNALTQIQNQTNIEQNCLKMAVWHHPLNSSGEDRIKDQGFMEQLAQAGFRIVLHGHVHKAENSLYRYDFSSQNGRKLDLISAGTFGAPTKELCTGYPWQYNLLELQENKLIVRTRRREEPNGAWKPDARWLQGQGEEPSSSYELSVTYSDPPKKIILPDLPAIQPSLETHYTMVARGIMMGRIIPFLGADINWCNRKKVGGKLESWRISPSDLPKYPPVTGELAVYLDETSDCLYSKEVGCELCDIPTVILPPGCPLKTRLMTKMPLDRVSQYLLVRKYEDTLHARLLELSVNSYKPNQLHDFLASLPAIMRGKRYAPPYQLIVTTCFDGTLEKAFKNAGESFHLVSFIWDRNGGKFVYQTPDGEQHPMARSHEYYSKASLQEKPVILRLYGGLDPKQFAISEDHYISYLANEGVSKVMPENLMNKLSDSNSQILFLGYSPQYWNLRVILNRIWPELSSRRRDETWWAIAPDLSVVEKAFWDNYDVYPINVPSLEEYIEGLNKAINGPLVKT